MKDLLGKGLELSVSEVETHKALVLCLQHREGLQGEVELHIDGWTGLDGLWGRSGTWCRWLDWSVSNWRFPQVKMRPC